MRLQRRACRHLKFPAWFAALCRDAATFVPFADVPRPPALVPTGQPDNSPAFQRRVIVGISTSPVGTAERTPQCSDHVPLFHLANLCRPSGTCIDFTANPALKCRAIVIASLRDFAPWHPGVESVCRLASHCFPLTKASTTAESASVVMSPIWSVWSSEILRRMRRMILPERVFGRPGAN